MLLLSLALQKTYATRASVWNNLLVQGKGKKRKKKNTKETVRSSGLHLAKPHKNLLCVLVN